MKPCQYCGNEFEPITNQEHCSVSCRFWSKVDMTGDCWLWTGSRVGIAGFEYGQFAITPTRRVHAHRYAWLLTRGDTNGLNVLHSCDNPPCVKPAHLFLGTQGDNMQDKSNKGRGRSPIGEDNGLAKLTEETVIQIREASASGVINSELARQFGVGGGTIAAIVTRRTWRHV
jgi:hypothetical protein